MRDFLNTQMSPILLKTLNLYRSVNLSAEEAASYVAGLEVFPLPDRLALDDWRMHVPMHLLEQWGTLTDSERVTIYVMAQSATHPHELQQGPEDPQMN